MKKIIGILLSVLFIVSLVGCNASAQSSQTAAESVANETAKDKLNDDELLLYEALIKITKDNFYEPSAVRLLDIEEIHDWTLIEAGSPINVIVRLQGENRVGGTLNHYYYICIVGSEYDEEFDETAQGAYDASLYFYGTTGNTFWLADAMNTKANFADCFELDDDYIQEYVVGKETYEYNKQRANEKINVGKINKALKEYWEDRGF